MKVIYYILATSYFYKGVIYYSYILPRVDHYLLLILLYQKVAKFVTLATILLYYFQK